MSPPDRLDRIFELQRNLNARLGITPATFGDEERARWLLQYCRAMTQEVAELTDCVPWKWWAKYQKLDLQNARVEIVDLLHFLVSLAQVAGMDADEFFDAYAKKHAVNHQRQDGGYAAKDENDSRHI